MPKTLLNQLDKASMYWMAGPWCTAYRGSGVHLTMTYIGSTQTKSPEDMDMPLSCSTDTSKNLSTNDGVNERRTGGRAGPTVDFKRDMVMKSKNEDLLSNKDNKQRFIRTLGQILEHVGCETRHAKVVETTVQSAMFC